MLSEVKPGVSHDAARAERRRRAVVPGAAGPAKRQGGLPQPVDDRVPQHPESGCDELVNGPITDATSLTGQWDFDLTFTQNKAQLAEAGAKGISLFDALEKQLGLKLEQKTIPRRCSPL